MEQFNLEIQYQKYLERVGFKESQMSDVQKKETKRAFFVEYLLRICEANEKLASIYFHHLLDIQMAIVKKIL